MGLQDGDEGVGVGFLGAKYEGLFPAQIEFGIVGAEFGEQDFHVVQSDRRVGVKAIVGQPGHGEMIASLDLRACLCSGQ